MSPAVSSISSSRRRLLGSAALLGLGGCGFRPLYAPVTAADGSQSDMADELSAVRVGPIYERTGQLLKRSLQRRLEDSQPGTPARYQLNVSIAVAADGSRRRPLRDRRDALKWSERERENGFGGEGGEGGREGEGPHERRV